MRILVVTNMLPPVVHGGYEVECEAVVAHLRGEHEVTVLTSAQGARSAPAEPGVLRVLPLADGGPEASLRAPLDAVRGVRIARHVLADVAPDLVYVWNGAGLPYAALQALHDSGRPLAHRVCEQWFGGLYGDDRFMRHLTPGETGLRGVWARGLQLVDRVPPLRTAAPRPPRPTAISYNSAFLRDAVGVPPPLRAVHVEVLLPATPQTDAMAAVRRDPAARPTVLFVGRLEEQKGAHVAVRALARLDREVVLTVVGPGSAERRAALEALAAQVGVADRVRFTGPLRGAALHAEVAAAHAWVVPSVWEEPAGLVCVEAGLARVPLVASRIGGIPELLRDHHEALLFAPGDDAACAAALEQSLHGGDAVVLRVERALARARQLGHGPYLAATDRFLATALAVSGRP